MSTPVTGLRVVVADDQDLVRSGLEMVLGARGIEVVGSAADGRAAVELVARTEPDVCLMDIRMPVLDGIAATIRLTELGLATRVLVLTTFDLDAYVYGALRAGAAGFLLKTTPPDRLVDGIATVAAGEALLAPVLTRRLIEEHVRGPAPHQGVPPALAVLTERELEVFGLVARGLSNADIQQRLVVSEATVKTHVNRILAKLGVGSRVQLVVVGYESGLIRPGGRGRRVPLNPVPRRCPPVGSARGHAPAGVPAAPGPAQRDRARGRTVPADHRRDSTRRTRPQSLTTWPTSGSTSRLAERSYLALASLPRRSRNRCWLPPRSPAPGRGRIARAGRAGWPGGAGCPWGPRRWPSISHRPPRLPRSTRPSPASPTPTARPRLM